MKADPPVRALLWRTVGRVLFRCTPYGAFRARRVILRWFGATLTPLTKVRRSTDIDRPWNLRIGSRSMVGDDVVIRAAAPVTIGDRCTVSQLGALVTEVRDPRAAGHPPRRAPIVLEDDAWVATDAVVLPGSTIREGAVIGARSTADGDYPAWFVSVGCPARPRVPRVIGAAAAE